MAVKHFDGQQRPGHEQRVATRNEVWPETEAVVKNFNRVLRGHVRNLGSRGMFLVTEQKLPIKSRLEIRIIFHTGAARDLTIDARGEAIWRSREGVGIRFTEIDVAKLGDCIIQMLNIQQINQERKTDKDAALVLKHL